MYTPMFVDILSLLKGALPLFFSSSMRSDLTLPAWERGSDAVKCHFSIAHKGSELLRGLIHCGGKTLE